MENKLFYGLALFIIAMRSFAQVGINTTQPKGALDINSEAKIIVNEEEITTYGGLVLPVVSSVSAVVNLQGGKIAKGTLVFSMADKCLRVFGSDGKWDGCLSFAGTIEDLFDYNAWEGVNFKAKKISAGNNFTLAIDYNTNALYASGEGTDYKKGTGRTTNETFVPILARHIVDVSAGYQHGLACDIDGNLWAWGQGEGYRLGNGAETIYYVPTEVTTPKAAEAKIIRVEAGYKFSLILDDQGNVYYAGTSSSFVNGLGDAAAVQSFTKINFLPETFIKDISINYFSAAALDSDGGVWTWGDSEFGRLGNGTPTAGAVTPTKITLPPIKKVAMGNRFGLAISEDGTQLYGWGGPEGWGESGSIEATPTDITGNISIEANNFTDLDRDGVVDSGFSLEFYSVAADTDNGNDFDNATATAATAAGAIVTTNMGAFAVNGDQFPSRAGLGYYERSTNSIYSPNANASPATSGFISLYNKNSAYSTILFRQVSIGKGHSVLLQSVNNEEGGLAYGMGDGTSYQLGSEYLNIPIPIYIKR
ncbi:MAG: hypothetical protein LBQ84_02785 [Flavobacteriaceae bacterium]|jgi:hypothetical protein|nr:hypothetical protein [Flavobacteriaceae bacterium]